MMRLTDALAVRSGDYYATFYSRAYDVDELPFDAGINADELKPAPDDRPSPVAGVQPVDVQTTRWQSFADAQPFTVTVTDQDQVIARRPAGRRVHLFLQNNDAANSVFVSYGSAATTASLRVRPGGSVFYDVYVPQNDVHVICSTGLTAQLVVIVADVADGA